MIPGSVRRVAGSLRLRPRTSLEVTGSPELHNGGPRRPEEASESVFACEMAGYPIISGGFLCINGFFLGSQATVAELLASPEVKGNPEL